MGFEWNIVAFVFWLTGILSSYHHEFLTAVVSFGFMFLFLSLEELK